MKFNVFQLVSLFVLLGTPICSFSYSKYDPYGWTPAPGDVPLSQEEEALLLENLASSPDITPTYVTNFFRENASNGRLIIGAFRCFHLPSDLRHFLLVSREMVESGSGADSVRACSIYLSCCIFLDDQGETYPQETDNVLFFLQWAAETEDGFHSRWAMDQTLCLHVLGWSASSNRLAFLDRSLANANTTDAGRRFLSDFLPRSQEETNSWKSVALSDYTFVPLPKDKPVRTLPRVRYALSDSDIFREQTLERILLARVNPSSEDQRLWLVQQAKNCPDNECQLAAMWILRRKYPSTFLDVAKELIENPNTPLPIVDRIRPMYDADLQKESR